MDTKRGRRKVRRTERKERGGGETEGKNEKEREKEEGRERKIGVPHAFLSAFPPPPLLAPGVSIVRAERCLAGGEMRFTSRPLSVAVAGWLAL